MHPAKESQVAVCKSFIPTRARIRSDLHTGRCRVWASSPAKLKSCAELAIPVTVLSLQDC